MKEIEVTAKLVQKFNSVPGCRAKKRHSGKFGSGAPDFNGCYLGRTFFFETKMETGELSELQATDLDRWMAVGASTAVLIYFPGSKEILAVTPSGPEFSWATSVGRKGMERMISGGGYLAKLRDFDPLRILPVVAP